MATGGPYAWGLCYNKEMSPSQTYCDDFYKYTYPCAPGAEYYGRGALPIYWSVYISEPTVSFSVFCLSKCFSVVYLFSPKSINFQSIYR